MSHKKILFVGDVEVGKTRIIEQYVYEKFTDAYEPTVGETYKKSVQLKDQRIDLLILDTSGNDEYQSFWKPELETTDLVYIVYSIDNFSSFQSCDKFYEEIIKSNRKIPIILLGNKMDLERAVSSKESREMAENFQSLNFETSAKNKYLVEDSFYKGIEILTKKENTKNEENLPNLVLKPLNLTKSQRFMSFFNSPKDEPKPEKDISRTRSFLNILISPRRDKEKKSNIEEYKIVKVLISPREYQSESEKSPKDDSQSILSPRMEQLNNILESDRKSLKILTPKKNLKLRENKKEEIKNEEIKEENKKEENK